MTSTCSATPSTPRSRRRDASLEVGDHDGVAAELAARDHEPAVGQEVEIEDVAGVVVRQLLRRAAVERLHVEIAWSDTAEIGDAGVGWHPAKASLQEPIE